MDFRRQKQNYMAKCFGVTVQHAANLALLTDPKTIEVQLTRSILDALKTRSADAG
jgi:hypothetical protein